MNRCQVCFNVEPFCTCEPDVVQAANRETYLATVEKPSRDGPAGAFERALRAEMEKAEEDMDRATRELIEGWRFLDGLEGFQ